ncbi:LOW QUALITY PROTEIN: paired immunoglobulin-like receptor B [Sminthopsis crassicaudata]|uniref:LOW QUALITY PROTEIN: paired immunoglobulin-like receptor B n=1 Tax=Sminthopsis crassicaudata TaxID=9301 RepID=UPI003D690482
MFSRNTPGGGSETMGHRVRSLSWDLTVLSGQAGSPRTSHPQKAEAQAGLRMGWSQQVLGKTPEQTPRPAPGLWQQFPKQPPHQRLIWRFSFNPLVPSTQEGSAGLEMEPSPKEPGLGAGSGPQSQIHRALGSPTPANWEGGGLRGCHIPFPWGSFPGSGARISKNCSICHKVTAPPPAPSTGQQGGRTHREEAEVKLPRVWEPQSQPCSPPVPRSGPAAPLPRGHHAPPLSILLCLGLCLNHGMRAQEDELPRPFLRAENGSLGPRGSRVTFRCRGSRGAAEYVLEKELGRELKVLDSVQSEEAEVEFSIPRMTLNDAGNYSCRYRTASRWSERSDPLELVVTDVYYPPSLSAWPNSTVAPGHNVTLQCHSQLFHDWFVLYKDRAQVTQATAQPHGRGSQANFPIPAVNSTHGGTYRCYSFQSDSPHWWSFPTDPLELRVTETNTENPEGQNWLFVFIRDFPGLSKKHASILLGVSALLILLFLLLLLLLCCRLHRARISNGSRGTEIKKTPRSSDPDVILMEQSLFSVEDLSLEGVSSSLPGLYHRKDYWKEAPYDSEEEEEGLGGGEEGRGRRGVKLTPPASLGIFSGARISTQKQELFHLSQGDCPTPRPRHGASTHREEEEVKLPRVRNPQSRASPAHVLCLGLGQRLPSPPLTPMSLALSILLCLGLFLDHRMRAQADELPRPSLRAENGSLSPLGSRVTFRCRGPPGAAGFRLVKELGSGLKVIDFVPSEEVEVKFSIPRMTLDHAGTYSCRYRKAFFWSEHSDPLELVATDVYRPPSLSAWPNSTVAPGHNVTLQCYSQLFHNWFVLYKDRAQVTQATAQPHGRGSQANFPIPAVNSAHGGTYRCFSFQSDSPHWWSFPTDPLELRVTETNTENPEGQNWLFGLSKKHASILLGVSALLILLFLLLLLLLLRCRRHRARISEFLGLGAAGGGPEPQGRLTPTLPTGNGSRGTEIKKTPRSSDPDVSLMEQSLCE